MTWLELAEQISRMTPEQKEQDVTIFDKCEEEYFPAEDLLFAGSENDVFEEDQPYLRF